MMLRTIGTILGLTALWACGGGGGSQPTASAGPSATAPRILVQPVAQSVLLGQAARFTVQAAGTEPLRYQWKRQGTDLVGATDATWVLPAAQKGDEGAVLTVEVRNAAGAVLSDPARLTVQWLPTFTVDLPATAEGQVGQPVVMTVATDAQPSATLAWYRQGQLLPGVTGSAWTWMPSLLDQGQSVVVIATNAVGSTSSRTCQLSVSSVPSEIPLTVRAHLDPATHAVYDTLRSRQGWILGLDALGSAANAFVTVPSAQVQARWAELYPGQGLPFSIEWEMGERNRPAVVRDWAGLIAFSKAGGLPWMMLSMNNFTVSFGSGVPPQGGMNDTRNHAAGVLPGGLGHAAFTAYVRQFAQEVKAAGVPVVLRPLHEGNGGWFWWGGNATDFKTLWRWMFQMFQEAGVRNVIWCWAASDVCSGSSCNATAFYPGDDVVDLLAVDLYFDGPSLTSNARNTLALLEGIGPDKPILLGEFGPKARADFWKQAAVDLAGIKRFRGFSFWLARGWKPWGGDPASGSLVDATTDAETRNAFLAFLSDSRVIKLGGW